MNTFLDSESRQMYKRICVRFSHLAEAFCVFLNNPINRKKKKLFPLDKLFFPRNVSSDFFLYFFVHLKRREISPIQFYSAIQ